MWTFGVADQQVTTLVAGYAARTATLQRDSAASTAALRPGGGITQPVPTLPALPQFGERRLAHIPRAEVG